MEQAKKLLSALSPVQIISILICGLAVAGGVAWFSRWERESSLRPLYTSLSPEDANAIIQKLREGGIEYRLTANGTSVLVPDTKIPELRLEMAGQGLPKTGSIGFEIFDKTNFGITDFAEHVNYRRAVEGELERSIMSLAEVQQARVHVTLPKESVFLESREAAKASILVGLRPGARLAAQNVTAITNLVSSAVEGLAPEAVSVVDMHGNLLSRPRRDASSEGLQISEAALDYRQAVERDLVAKISNTLEPLLGVDKFRTGVSADVDMTSGEQSEESFDPTKSVMLTSQKTEDSNTVTRPPSSPPGTAANLPQAQPAPAGQPATPPATPQTGQAAPATPATHAASNGTNSVKRTENVTYQSSRTVKHVKLPQGTIKRLSIAVLLDQAVKWEGQGKNLQRIVVPPAPEKLKTIQSIVATLVGLNTQRGDQLTVETLPFDTTLNFEPPTAGTATTQEKKPADTGANDLLKNKPIVYGAAAGAVLILIVIGFGFARARKRRADIEVEQPLELPPATAVTASAGTLNPGVQPASALPALMPSRTEALLAQLQETGRNNPELWAGILRGWLAEEEAGS